MIKLQDFAVQQGVTDRQVQRLLKKYEEELQGHYERKGPNGTWLTDEACDILRSKMKQAPAAVFEPDPRVGQLQQDLAATKQELNDTKVAAREIWEQLKEKDKRMNLLLDENNELRLQAASVPLLEADNEAARVKTQEAVEAAQKAQDELKKAQEKAVAERAEKEAWKKYAADLDEYNAKNWFQRRKAEKPIPPVFLEG